jgi:hypothetical protein
MSIQWADDFSRYGLGALSDNAMLEGLPYAVIGTTGDGGEVVNDPDPNESGRAFEVGQGGSNVSDFRIALPTVVTGTLRSACRFWLSNLPTNSNQLARLVAFLEVDADTLLRVVLQQNGSVKVFGPVSGTVVQVADTINPVVSPSSWNHWEVEHNMLTGAGALYINGVSRLTWAGVDGSKSAALINYSHRDLASPSIDLFMKDLVIADSLGSVNNTTIGTVIVRRLKPNADSTLGGWVPSTGLTGFNLLAKDAPNDATYLSATPSATTPMVFNLENLPTDVTSVRGLISVVRMRKVDGGDATVQTGLSPNNTNWDDGADRPITSAFTYSFDVSELDPATATAWSPAAVDTALVRVDRTT